MQGRLLICAVTILSGCATSIYDSNRSAANVAECIAAGWKKSPKSGYDLPVSFVKNEGRFFVGVSLGGGWYGIPSGARHSSYPVWAEVSESVAGSTTEYHRAYQVSHDVIDRVVRECQGPK